MGWRQDRRHDCLGVLTVSVVPVKLIRRDLDPVTTSLCSSAAVQLQVGVHVAISCSSQVKTHLGCLRLRLRPLYDLNRNEAHVVPLSCASFWTQLPDCDAM